MTPSHSEGTVDPRRDGHSAPALDRDRLPGGVRARDAVGRGVETVVVGRDAGPRSTLAAGVGDAAIAAVACEQRSDQRSSAVAGATARR